MVDRHAARSARGSFNSAVGGQAAPPKKSFKQMLRIGTKSAAEEHESRGKLQKMGPEYGNAPTPLYQPGQDGDRSPSIDEGLRDGSELPLHGASPHPQNYTSRFDPGRSSMPKPDSLSQRNANNSESGDAAPQRERKYEPLWKDPREIMNTRFEVSGEPIQTAPNRGWRDSQHELAGTAVDRTPGDHRSKHHGSRDQSNNHSQKPGRRSVSTAGHAEASGGGGGAVSERWDARVSNGMSNPPNPMINLSPGRSGTFQNDADYDPYRPREVDGHTTTAYSRGTGTVGGPVPELAPRLPQAENTSFGDMMGANGQLPGLSPSGYAEPGPDVATDNGYLNAGGTMDRSREHPRSLLDARGQAAAERAGAHPHYNNIDADPIDVRVAELLRPYSGLPSPGAAWFHSLMGLVERGQDVLEQERHQDSANLRALALDLAKAEAGKKMYEEKYVQMTEFRGRYERAQRTITEREQDIFDLRSKLRAVERSLEQQIESLKLDYESELKRAEARACAELKRAQEQAAQREKELKAEIEELGVRHVAETARIRGEADEKVRRTEEQAQLMTKQLNDEVSTLTRRMASYSTNDYIAIPDEDLGLAFRTLSQKVTNMSGRFPRPEEWSSLGDLDPTDFLGRVLQQQGSNRSWPKFVRHVCWGVLLRGFFHHPLGFGALGSQGIGHDEVLRVYHALERPVGNAECLPRVYPELPAPISNRTYSLNLLASSPFSPIE